MVLCIEKERDSERKYMQRSLLREEWARVDCDYGITPESRRRCGVVNFLAKRGIRSLGSRGEANLLRPDTPHGIFASQQYNAVNGNEYGHAESAVIILMWDI